MEFKEMQRMLWKMGNRGKIIKDLKFRIEELKEESNSMREYKAVTLTGLPHAQGNFDKIGATAAKLEDIDKKINDELIPRIEKNFYEMEDLWLLMMEVLTPEEYAVLKERYINGYGWDFIPGRVNMCRRLCFKLHKDAIKKLMAAYTQGF